MIFERIRLWYEKHYLGTMHYSKEREALKQIIKDAGEYRWHNLEANPNDVPKTLEGGYSEDVVIAVLDAEGNVSYYSGYYVKNSDISPLWYTYMHHDCSPFKCNPLFGEKLVGWKKIEKINLGGD